MCENANGIVVKEMRGSLALIGTAEAIGIFRLRALRPRKENRDYRSGFVGVWDDISATLESADDNVPRMNDWRQNHQN